MVPQKRDDAVRNRFINESTFETNQFQTEINQGGPLGMFAKRPPLKAYLVALRPWSFTASLTPVCLGSCLAYKSIGIFNIWIVLATCFTALSVHAAGNLVNTYFDFKRGVDKTNAAQDRTLVDRLLPEADVVNFGQLCYLMGCAGFVTLVCISPAKMEHLAFVFFGGLSGSFLYTGGLGLKYVALGDVAIFFTFGPITVLFSFMAQGGTMCWMPIGYALPLALNIAVRSLNHKFYFSLIFRQFYMLRTHVTWNRIFRLAL